jgi:hypothetical protein
LGAQSMCRHYPVICARLVEPVPAGHKVHTGGRRCLSRAGLGVFYFDFQKPPTLRLCAQSGGTHARTHTHRDQGVTHIATAAASTVTQGLCRAGSLQEGLVAAGTTLMQALRLCLFPFIVQSTSTRRRRPRPLPSRASTVGWGCSPPWFLSVRFRRLSVCCICRAVHGGLWPWVVPNCLTVAGSENRPPSPA